jgi:TM2 domain-containing membrane protein YozV
VPDPGAPYGRDPATGEPLSDKYAVAAGCLQLFVGMLGVGRFYIGSVALGGVQLALTFIGLLLTIVLVGFFILFGVAVWTFIDAIMMFTGNVKDAQGRKLR